MNIKLIYIFLFLPFLLFAMPKNSPYPGGVAVIDLGYKKQNVTFDGKKVFVNQEKNKKWYAWVGISLAEKRKSIDIKIENQTKTINLKSKEYKKQYITLKGDRKKYVGLSKENLNRHYGEKALSKKVLQSYSSVDIGDFKFAKPVNTNFSNTYGKRRYFNNQPRKPHSGTDMSAKQGTPIKAPLSGRVKIAKEFFFSGNVIYIDHGRGLVTMYAHLDKFHVKDGDFVFKGDIIGKVGKTGRVTGPHLHYGVALNGNMVDPKLFY
jgi:murein DD-endopeptidase MepM/ murein hydrolase activator NlpD